MTWILRRTGISNALIVGQAPAQRDDPTDPLSGRSGRRLADLMAMPHEEFLCTFDRANLLDYWPGKQGKGDAWPREEAIRSAASLYDRYLGPGTCEYDWVLLLGRNVIGAFSADILYVMRMMKMKAKINWLEWKQAMPQALYCAVCPHPSGVNRWWNDDMNMRRARSFFTQWRTRVERQQNEADVPIGGTA